MKNAKKLLSLALALAMLVSMFGGLSIAALAEDAAAAAKITVGNASVDVSKDTTVVVPVTISDNPGFMSANLAVNVGDAPLTLAKVEAGSILPAGTSLDTETSILMLMTDDLHENGELLKLTFTVNDNAKNGSYPIALEPANKEGACFGNYDEEEVPVTFVAGTVTVTGAPEPSTVPTLKEGVQDKTDVVKTGAAYLLPELQAGSIFEAPAGAGEMTYWYEKSTDGETFSAKTKLEKPNDSTMSVSVPADGTCVFRFYASCDGGDTFSESCWTLTLTASANPIR